jgi:hypothetical protein
MYASLILYSFCPAAAAAGFLVSIVDFDICMSMGKGEDEPKYTDAESKATTFPCASVIAAASAAGAAGVADVWGERAVRSR